MYASPGRGFWQFQSVFDLTVTRRKCCGPNRSVRRTTAP